MAFIRQKIRKNVLSPGREDHLMRTDQRDVKGQAVRKHGDGGGHETCGRGWWKIKPRVTLEPTSEDRLVGYIRAIELKGNWDC